MDLLVYLGLLLIALIPSVLLYLWLKKKSTGESKEVCKKAFTSGILSCFPIILVSMVLHIVEKLLNIDEMNPILYNFYHTFIVLAFAEELVKFLTFKSLLKKNPHKYSWFNLVVFMTIIGIGFGAIENVAVAVGSNVIVMLIRGISMGHAGYGFIMGWFYGKMMKTGKKIYGYLSFIIPWLLHGLYDFGLTDELLKVNDNFAFISVSLELVCIIFVFVIIRFVKKREKSDTYTKPVMSI